MASADAVAVEILVGGQRIRLRAADGGFKASVALERPADINGSWIIGDTARTRTSRSSTPGPPSLWSGRQGCRLFDASFGADHVIVNIELGGDSFLSSVLPPSLRLDTQLGLGVEPARGFYLNGGVALVVDLPVNVTIGPAAVLDLVLQALHLRLGFTDAPIRRRRRPLERVLQRRLHVDADRRRWPGGVFSATVAGIGVAYSITRQERSERGPERHRIGTAGHWQPAAQLRAAQRARRRRQGRPGRWRRLHRLRRGGRDEYTGALQLHIGLSAISVDITALGMLDTKIPGSRRRLGAAAVAVRAVLAGDPARPGHHAVRARAACSASTTRLDSDAIAAGLRTQSLDAILFPPDPVAQAPHIFAIWRQTMPISVGHTVVGPMIQARVGRRRQPVHARAGGADRAGPQPGADRAARQLQVRRPPPTTCNWSGCGPTCSAGSSSTRSTSCSRPSWWTAGWAPSPSAADWSWWRGAGRMPPSCCRSAASTPSTRPPANVPVADRIRVDIRGTDNPRLRLEAYLAITSQSFQFGARVELHAAAGPLALDGWLGLDVLIQWLPHFRFSAEISGGPVAVLRRQPGARGLHRRPARRARSLARQGLSASLTLLFFTLSLPIDASWGDDSGPTASTAQPLALVRDALSARDAWSASMPPGASTIVDPAGPDRARRTRPPARGRGVPGSASYRSGWPITHVGNQPRRCPDDRRRHDAQPRRGGGAGYRTADRGLRRRPVPRSHR